MTVRCGHCGTQHATLDSASAHIAVIHPVLSSPPRGSGSSWSADDIGWLRRRAAYMPVVTPPSAARLSFGAP